jgi:hypothetical protein
MAALVWDQVGDRLFETGISKGVLYQDDGYGVPWNGLTSIEESVSNEVEPVHYDGVKFNDIVTVGDFSAILRAFTYPDEFLYYEGTLKDQTGFYIYNQSQSMFGLSYQTRIGDDVSGVDSGYKIHVLYNLTALPSQRTYQTLSMDTEPLEFEWSITSIPQELENFRPTAHVAFNSREIDKHLLQDIEDILYGNEDTDARLPSLQGLATFIRKWDRLIITDHEDGTWTADSSEEGIITMIDSTTFQIVSDTATYLDATTYTISSTNKNEEDIWLP